MKYTVSKSLNGSVIGYTTKEELNGVPVRISVVAGKLTGRHYIIKHPSLSTVWNQRPEFYNLANAKKFIEALFV